MLVRADQLLLAKGLEKGLDLLAKGLRKNHFHSQFPKIEFTALHLLLNL